MTTPLPPACVETDAFLVELAYGEESAVPASAREHLASCERCQAELRALTGVRTLAGSVPLEEPSDQLDANVLAALDAHLAQESVDPFLRLPEPTSEARPKLAVLQGGAAEAPAAGVEARRKPARRRWTWGSLAAAASIAVVAGGTWLVQKENGAPQLARMDNVAAEAPRAPAAGNTTIATPTTQAEDVAHFAERREETAKDAAAPPPPPKEATKEGKPASAPRVHLAAKAAARSSNGLFEGSGGDGLGSIASAGAGASVSRGGPHADAPASAELNAPAPAATPPVDLEQQAPAKVQVAEKPAPAKAALVPTPPAPAPAVSSSRVMAAPAAQPPPAAAPPRPMAPPPAAAFDDSSAAMQADARLPEEREVSKKKAERAKQDVAVPAWQSALEAGRAAAAQHNYNTAEAAFSRVLSFNVPDAVRREALEGRATALLALGRDDDADQVLAELARRYPSSAVVRSRAAAKPMAEPVETVAPASAK